METHTTPSTDSNATDNGFAQQSPMTKKLSSDKHYYIFLVTYLVLMSALGSFVNDMYTPVPCALSRSVISSQNRTKFDNVVAIDLLDCETSVVFLLLSLAGSNCSDPRFQYVIVLFQVENNGFEPLTPCLQNRCSSQLS